MRRPPPRTPRRRSAQALRPGWASRPPPPAQRHRRLRGRPPRCRCALPPTQLAAVAGRRLARPVTLAGAMLAPRAAAGADACLHAQGRRPLARRLAAAPERSAAHAPSRGFRALVCAAGQAAGECGERCGGGGGSRARGRVERPAGGHQAGERGRRARRLAGPQALRGDRRGQLLPGTREESSGA